MDCVSFRRKLLEAPLRNEADFLAHEESCPNCGEYARRTRAQEAQLRALLNVSAPPELAERIKLAVTFDRRPARARRRWLNLAAGVLLVAGALGLVWQLSPLERRGLELADAVLHHVNHELHHLHEVNAVGAAQLAELFGAFGAHVSGDLGPVNFAAECLMRKKNGIHLVLPGQKGPVTVFFMPDENPGQAQTVSDRRFHGEVLPTAWGSIAVIGSHGEPLSGVARRVLGAVDWSQRLAAIAPQPQVRPPRA